MAFHRTGWRGKEGHQHIAPLPAPDKGVLSTLIYQVGADVFFRLKSN